MISRIAVAVLSAFVAASAGALPSAELLLAETGFSDEEKQRIHAGEFVTSRVKETSERELAVEIAFLMKVPVSRVIEEAHRQIGLEADPGVHQYGEIRGQGDLAAFERVRPGSDAAKDFLDAEPGQGLNLDTAEIEAFRKLRGSGAADTESVERELQGLLLARYRAYRASGLEGIASYDRGGGKKTSPGDELRGASKAAALLHEHVPSFYATLVGYPKEKPPQLEEYFSWNEYETEGAPTYALSHRFRRAEGDGYVFAERQYYVTRSYNSEQALALILPFEEGTLVLYLNRTSTDQVLGFGGGGKRAIGRELLASELKKAFDVIRAEIEKSTD